MGAGTVLSRESVTLAPYQALGGLAPPSLLRRGQDCPKPELFQRSLSL